jgi:hypothetical protein
MFSVNKRRRTKLEESKNKCVQLNIASLVGPIWYIGWLFTVALTQLTFGKAVFALVIWPYYLGVALR